MSITTSLLTIGVPVIPGVPGDNGSGHSGAPLLPSAPPGVHGGAGGLSAGPGGLPAVPGVPGGGADPAGKTVVDATLRPIVSFVGDTAVTFWKWAVGLWLHVPTPEISGKTGAVADLLDGSRWICAAVAVLALLVVAAKMAFSGDVRRPGSDLVRGVLVYVSAAGLAVAIVPVLSSAMDSIGLWLLDRAAGSKDLDARVGTIVTGLGAINPGVVVFLGCLLIIPCSIAMIALAVVRGAVLIWLVGFVLPMTAAASATDGGWAACKRVIGWILSWALLKLAACSLIATGWWLIGDGTNALDVVSGLIISCLTLLALPTLLRLFAHLTQPGPHAIDHAGGMAALGMMAAAGRAGMSGAQALDAKGSKSSVPTGAVNVGAATKAGPLGAATNGVRESVRLVKDSAARLAGDSAKE